MRDSGPCSSAYTARTPALCKNRKGRGAHFPGCVSKIKVWATPPREHPSFSRPSLSRPSLRKLRRLLRSRRSVKDVSGRFVKDVMGLNTFCKGGSKHTRLRKCGIPARVLARIQRELPPLQKPQRTGHLFSGLCQRDQKPDPAHAGAKASHTSPSDAALKRRSFTLNQDSLFSQPASQFV